MYAPIASGFCLAPLLRSDIRISCDERAKRARHRGELCDNVANSRRKALALSLVAWFEPDIHIPCLGAFYLRKARS